MPGVGSLAKPDWNVGMRRTLDGFLYYFDDVFQVLEITRIKVLINMGNVSTEIVALL
jgi:hypothetical protein